MEANELLVCTCLLLMARIDMDSEEHPHRIPDPFRPCPIHPVTYETAQKGPFNQFISERNFKAGNR